MTKIVKISGGLGNQLFQYANGLHLSKIDKKKVIFDTFFFNGGMTHKDTSRVFLLDKFNIDTSFTFKPVHRSKLAKFIQKIYSKITGDYGFYPGEKYVKDIYPELLEQFTVKGGLSAAAQAVANMISNTPNSVSIHIRRGDYVTSPVASKHNGLCGLDYYYEAAQIIQSKISNPAFFVFSDDIAWAKENLKLENIIFVSSPEIQDYEELMLMSLCQHDIIANSTFSWWGAYLNKNHGKIVISPKQWTIKNTSNELNILPSSWIQI